MSAFWTCPVPGCRGPRSHGAGYASQSQADAARLRHLTGGNAEHRAHLRAASSGGAR